MQKEKERELLMKIDENLKEMKKRVLKGSLCLDDDSATMLKMIKIKTDELVAICMVANGG